MRHMTVQQAFDLSENIPVPLGSAANALLM